MKKRVISGVFAVLLAVSAVTGISAASDMELSGELQETFQDETEEEEIPIEEQEPEFSYCAAETGLPEAGDRF